ncbi:MAG: AEC family transporter [Marmoricola sp.]
MLDVLAGFSTITVVVAVGYLLAWRGVLDEVAQHLLSRVAFFVATPALLLVILARTPLSGVLSPMLVASALSVVPGIGLWWLISRRWSLSTSDRVLGSMAATYVNSANLGIPVAAYVLGDVSLMAPVLLFQLLIFTPVCLSLLDGEQAGLRPRPWTLIKTALRNPITIGSVIGLVISVSQVHVPELVLRPIELIGNIAVPAMLLSFGVSLRLGPRPGAHGSSPLIATLVALKLVAQPLAAAAIGVAFGLHGHQLYAVCVAAALPTAQNIFTLAMRYQRSVPLIRDAIFVSTFASVPVIFAISWIFHG